MMSWLSFQRAFAQSLARGSFAPMRHSSSAAGHRPKRKITRAASAAACVPTCAPIEALVEIGFTPEEANKVKTFKGKGCPSCNDTGYKGRIGLYEVMEITDEIRELILIGASSLELRKKSIEDGMITLREAGLYKIRNGVTTIEEVLRETVA